MDYKKPEIAESCEAVSKIQGTKNGEFQDILDVHRPMQTAAAYEADE
jgi:hypothetical protein